MANTRILIRAIRTRREFNPEYFKEEIRREFNQEVKRDLIADYEEIVHQWTNKPDFQGRLIIQNIKIMLDVYATGIHKDQFNLVSAGAPRHMIFPTPPNKNLRFQTGYTPASRPNQIYGGRKTRFGPTVYRRSVNHPGFEARNFHQTVADKYKPELRRRMDNALKRAARRI